MKTTCGTHIALYGSVKVRRSYCEECKEWAMVNKEGLKQCCDKPLLTEPTQKKRKELLEQFNNSCCYCGKRFGSTVSYNGKERLVRVAWDHVIPFSYSYNNEGTNFLPACSFCNQWKSNLMFQTLEEVQILVNNKWSNMNG